LLPELLESQGKGVESTMNRNSSALISIGIAAGMIAAGIWYLYDHHIGLFYGAGRGLIRSGLMSGNGMGIAMIIFWLVLLVVLALVAFGGTSETRKRINKKRDAPDALEILKRRYARGEINKAEYETKRRDIQA
jgi:putative membrane protein